MAHAVVGKSLKWRGHVERASEECLTKTVLWTGEKKIRSEGCPCLKWMDGVNKAYSVKLLELRDTNLGKRRNRESMRRFNRNVQCVTTIN